MSAGARSQVRDVIVRAADSGSIDAFSRWRVSNPVTLFDNQQQYGDNDLLWENSTSGGTVTSQVNRASVLLSAGGATSGNYAYRQTRTHFRYQPGKSQMALLTFVLGASYSAARSRIGAFDAYNGFFLERASGAVSLVKRSYTSGAAVDTPVAQTAWDDPMDGRGRSGVKIDFTKAQILVIDFQWLGVGRVRIGFDIDGLVVYCHEFVHANYVDVVYMTSANLPVRAEVENTGAAGGTTTLEQICTSIVSEGGFETERGLPFSADTTNTLIAVTARRPVLSIRAKATGPNAVINTGQILPVNYNVLCEDNSALVEIIRNPTTLLNGAVAPTWVDVDANRSIAQYNRDATVIAGGIKIASFPIPSGGGGPLAAAGAASFNALAKIPLVRTTLLNVQDVVSVVVTQSSGTANTMATINWQELY